MEPTLNLPRPEGPRGHRSAAKSRRASVFVGIALVAVFATAGVAIGIFQGMFRTGTSVNTALSSSTGNTPGATAPRQPTSTQDASGGGAATGGQSRSDLPVRVDVDKINAHSSLVQLGLNTDKTVQVPPVNEPSQAGWYKFGVRPGELGRAVILGHVDGDGRLGVFNRLRDLASGDVAKVTEQSGQVLNFVVRQVREVPKNQFPTQAVYGPSNQRELRLITCGGQFDHSTGNYVDNIIVSAVLSS
jgi:Sortase domain